MRNTLIAALGGGNLVGALVPAMALALSLMLAACGGAEPSGRIRSEEGEISYSIDRERKDVLATFIRPDGERTIISSGAGAMVALPQGFALLRGAQVLSSTSLARGADLASMVMFSTSEAPGQVVAHYLRQARAAGLAIRREAGAGGWQAGHGEGAGGLVFSIQARPGPDGATLGHLTVSRLI